MRPLWLTLGVKRLVRIQTALFSSVIMSANTPPPSLPPQKSHLLNSALDSRQEFSDFVTVYAAIRLPEMHFMAHKRNNYVFSALKCFAPAYQFVAPEY